MGTYTALAAQVKSAIKDNGQMLITGNVMQEQLLSVINSLGDGARFKGVAEPSTNPGAQSDHTLFYLAATAGTYTSFGGIELSEGELCVLSNETGGWVKQTFFTAATKGDVDGLTNIVNGIEGLPEGGQDGQVLKRDADGKAVWGDADVAADIEGVKTVDVTELDGMNTRDYTLPGASAYYKVTAKEMLPSLVGTLAVFSDNMRHVVTQVLTTHYSFNDNGVLDYTGHTDAKIYRYFRSYGLNAANVPNGAWTAWAELHPEKAETAELVRFGGSVSSANMLQMSVAQAIEGAKVWWVESAGAFGYGVEPGGIIVAPGVGLYLNWAGIEGVPDRTEFCDAKDTARRDRLFIDDEGGLWAANSSGALVRASGGTEDVTVEIVAGEI